MKLNEKGSPRYEMLPWDVLDEVVEVFMFGGEKHGEQDFKSNHNAEEYYAKIVRHAKECFAGRKFDNESGKHHAAHIATDALIALWIERRQGIQRVRDN